MFGMTPRRRLHLDDTRERGYRVGMTGLDISLCLAQSPYYDLSIEQKNAKRCEHVFCRVSGLGFSAFIHIGKRRQNNGTVECAPIASNLGAPSLEVAVAERNLPILNSLIEIESFKGSPPSERWIVVPKYSVALSGMAERKQTT